MPITVSKKSRIDSYGRSANNANDSYWHPRYDTVLLAFDYWY